jgi:hypothetical protein
MKKRMYISLFRILLCLSSFGLLACSVNSEDRELDLDDRDSAIFNVKKYGAIGDGQHDDSVAFQEASAAAIRFGPGAVILIPGGEYVLSHISDAKVKWAYPFSEELQGKNPYFVESGHWTFANVEGLHIKGEYGAKLLFQNPEHAGLVFLRCRNVRIEGLTVDYDPLPFTQGEVVEIDRVGNTFTVKIDAGYPEPDRTYFSSKESKLQARRFYLMDQETGDFYRDIPPFDIDAIQRVNDTYVLTSRRKILDKWDGGLFVMMARRAKHAFRLIDTGGFLLEDVTVHSAPAQAFNEMTGLGGNQYIRCRVGLDEGRLMSVNADALFSKRMRVGPILQDCHFEKMDDDGGNIGSTYLRVLSHPTDDSIILDLKSNHLIEAGDRFVLSNGSTGVVQQEAYVKACQIVRWRGTMALQVTMDRDLNVQQTVDKLGGSSEYGPPVKQAGGGNEKSVPDLAMDMDTICEGLVIEGCFIKDSRVRGLRLYTKSARIENNRFENLAKPGITMGQSLSWFEGPWSEDIIIRNNIFSGGRATGIYIGDFSVSIDSMTLKDNRNILIEGNRFEDYGRPFADGLKYVKALLRTAIVVRNAEDVSVIDNSFTPSASAPDLPYIVVDPETTSDVTLKGNRLN